MAAFRERYRLIAELAVGGMGITYRAWDTQAKVPVVVKMPKPQVRGDHEVLARFQREIDAMRAVPHASIVPITDSGDDDGCPFVVMRFLPGGSLADHRRRDGAGVPIKNPPGMLHFWLPGVAAALDHIASRGLLHRDVKPGNIFLDGFLRPFLGDFGIAKVVNEAGGLAKERTLTNTSMAVGTPEYMAPELFNSSEIDGRADQYALAVTVYEMLAGEKPFTGSAERIIGGHLAVPVPPLERHCPGLPESLCKAVHRALSKQPTSRFTSCRQFAAAALADLPPLERDADTVRLLCPNCRSILKLSWNAAGRKGRCPTCRAAMDVAADLGSLWLQSEEWSDTPGDASYGAEPLRRAGGGVADGPSGKTSRRAPAVGRGGVSIAVAFAMGVVLGGVMFAGGWMRLAGPPRGPGVAVVSREDAAAEIRRLDAALATARQELDAVSREAASATEVVPPTQPPDPVQPPADDALLENSIGMTLRLVPAGRFTMGDARGYEEEKPRHDVTISRAFYMSIHEVTNAQWRAVMAVSPSQWQDDNRPVERVTWSAAEDFCRRLGQRDPEMQANRRYRLPTEAEWEYACRAGADTSWSFGADGSRLAQFGWFGGNAAKETHPVGLLQPNAWGLYDMHGNVREWCADWYGAESYKDVPTREASSRDPPGPFRGRERVVRGGCWQGNEQSCRSAIRSYAAPDFDDSRTGFRVVAEAP